jgi:hypothetical protein
VTPSLSSRGMARLNRDVPLQPLDSLSESHTFGCLREFHTTAIGLSSTYLDPLRRRRAPGERREPLQEDPPIHGLMAVCVETIEEGKNRMPSKGAKKEAMKAA